MLPVWAATTQYYLAGAALLVVIGYLDDRRSISIGVKTAGQIGAACCLVFGGGVVIHNMGNLLGLGDIYLGGFAPLFTVFAIVGLINAVNMLDGMDGMVGGVCLALCIPLAWLVYAQGGFAVGAILVFAVAVAGFLLFNLRMGNRHARTFMGDAGSMLLGYTIAWFVIFLSQAPGSDLRPMAVLWIVAVPVMDTFRLIGWRVLTRQSPFSADNTHLHHILVNRGYSVNATVAVASLVTLILSATAFYISTFQFADPILFYGFAAIFLLFFVVTSRVLRMTKRAVPHVESAAELSAE